MNTVHKYQVCFAAPTRARTEIEHACTAAAGGVTLLTAQGVWENDDGEIEREPVVVGLVGVRDKNSVDRLRAVLRGVLESIGERCMWFTVQPITGGLIDLDVESGIADDRRNDATRAIRVAG